jgi:hypothetical protein
MLQKKRMNAMIIPELTSYPLPEGVRQTLLDLADQSDALFVGEIHGTQEPPRLISGLLDGLTARGYGALALEVPHTTRELLVAWAESTNDAVAPPSFYAKPGLDGRGNVQMLGLIRAAVRSGWQLLCFDQADDEWTAPFVWTERDRRMAENIAAQQARLAPNAKIIAICGNMHSRTVAPAPDVDVFWRELWPSCAAVFQQLHPHARVNSVNPVFHAGSYFNGSLKSDLGSGEPLTAPEIRRPADAHHTLYLHLPRATAATFLAEPADP